MPVIMEKKIKQPQLNLRRVMNEKGVDDQWLAVHLGISRVAVNQMVNGHSDPRLGRLYQIAEVLEVRFFDLFK